MTNKERYKQAFSVLHASDNISLEANRNMEKKKIFKPARKLVIVCICTVMILSLGLTAYAYGVQVVSKIFGWGNNFELTREKDEDKDGNSATEATVDADNLTEPVIIDGDKMTFIVNDESIDITDQVSKTEAFQYEYVDKEGNTHIWLIGLNSDDIQDYGYAEYIKDSEGKWVGGYSIGVDVELGAQWLENAEKELNMPW